MDDIPAVMETDSNQHVQSASIADDKKRQSGEYTTSTTSSMDAKATTFTSATPSSSTPQRSGSLKKMTLSSRDEASSAVNMSGGASSSSSSKARHSSHSRTQSIHLQPPKKKYGHVRRGSLPPLQINPNTNKLAHVDFGSPIRSPFATSIPPLPEKISIQIPHPKSDLSHIQIVKNKNIIENLSYIGLWYFFSTSLSLYNKNLMGKDRFNFNFPLLLSAIHAGLHALITSAMMSFGGSRWNTTKATLSLHDYVYKVVPCGIAAALEISCANASLMYVTLSFYTMVKSSTPIWVLLFSFIFGFEKPRVRLVAIIGLMVVGVILTVEGETKFDMVGFLLVLVAAVVSGLRWNLTQFLLQEDRLGMDNPIATLYHLSPIMFVIMLLLSLIFENPVDQFKESEHFDSIFHVMESFGLMSIGGFLAFAMTLAELYLIKSTNTVTLSVAGISKEIVIISLSVMIYGDVLTPKTLLGLFVSIVGIIWYNYYKMTRNQHMDGNQYQMIPMHGNSKLED
ncbi:hypothetical protein O0I10_007373 [Lichtheimia ornata]|uniref:Sugar phosphate transporter domain-containing protein n=1 Tax=Lichtheimia ornata TaxID=688661 RepID=A0AAD7V0H3_9FUNG|nr:uncharacterized protein O0I10_007373 [Lichtheimia ornata]KAJ8657039.1 hypothetical protein O0I10_007373 [Lichtheimia ornata]